MGLSATFLKNSPGTPITMLTWRLSLFRAGALHFFVIHSLAERTPISPQDRRPNLSVRDFRAARLCFKSGKFILQVTEYDHAATVANEAITEAVARYLHDSMLEKEERQEEGEGA
jgi:hypothetical protein